MSHINALAFLLKDALNDRLINPNELERAILEKLVSANEKAERGFTTPPPTVYQDVKNEDFLNPQKLCGNKVNGNTCVDLLSDCLINGSQGGYCADKWASLDWANGIDFSDADRGAMRKLADKLQLNSKTPQDIKTELETAKGGKLNDSVVLALKNIQKIAYPEKVSSVPVDKSAVASTASVGVPMLLLAVPPRIPTVSNNMRGGGNSKLLYANFVRSMNNLRLYGGAGEHTAEAVRSSLRGLVSLLHANGKAIEQQDLNRLNDAIDSLERSESRVRKADEYIRILNRALQESGVDTKSLPASVTLKIIEDFGESRKKSATAVSKKITSLTDIMTALEKLIADVEAIKSKSP